jgi:hypothetical protein
MEPEDLFHHRTSSQKQSHDKEMKSDQVLQIMRTGHQEQQPSRYNCILLTTFNTYRHTSTAMVYFHERQEITLISTI